MEIPADVTIKTLQGSWTLDKTIADDADRILTLQGVGWLTRKAISAATMTLHFTSTQSPDTPTTHLKMRQTLTGGIPGSTEDRIMDWAERERSNHIYGEVLSRSRLIGGVRGEDGNVRPELELQSQAGSSAIEEEVRGFLCAGVPDLSSVEEKEGRYGDLYIHDFGRNEKGGWTAEQIWCIEVIEGKKYLARRIAVVREDGYELARLVYRFSAL
ncbi:hypothetical protein BJX61DRAFT_539368 [Aspergillus egyptiacus]|nr:hypothetical protein BJX61DRAFT_539368 [Aspergillus egyptiacus]